MKEIAELFFEQCAGEYSGHMAAIPNNPVLFSICNVCGVRGSKREFSKMLRNMADALDKSQENQPF